MNLFSVYVIIISSVNTEKEESNERYEETRNVTCSICEKSLFVECAILRIHNICYVLFTKQSGNKKPEYGFCISTIVDFGDIERDYVAEYKRQRT